MQVTGAWLKLAVILQRKRELVVSRAEVLSNMASRCSTFFVVLVEPSVHLE